MPVRRGLSMVEMLLVLGIIVMLVGLLLPAVARHRTHHRGRSQCANNLKHIALAVHAYTDAHQGKLPPLVDVGEGARTGAGLRSLLFNLLPYVGQDNVYRMLNTADPGTYYGPTVGAARTVIRGFVDPHDTTASNGSVQAHMVTLADAPPAPYAGSFTGHYATTSYAANGAIPWNTGGLPTSFADGTSNTILFAERYQLCTDANAVTTPNLWGLGAWDARMPTFAALGPAGASTGQALSDAPPNGSPNYVAGPIKVKVGPTAVASAVQGDVPAPAGCSPAAVRFRRSRWPRGGASRATRGWPRRLTPAACWSASATGRSGR